MDRHHRRTHLHHQRVKRAPQATLTEVHYVTLTPTFKGPVAGYVTVTPSSNKKPQTVETTNSPSRPQTTLNIKAPAPTTKAQTTPSTTKKPSSTTKAVSSSASVEKSSSTKEAQTTIKVQTATSSEIDTASYSTTTTLSHTADYVFEATSTLTSTPTSISSNDDAKSGGASVGGIVGGCAAAVLVLFFVAAIFYRKRKQRAMNQAYGKTEDEKGAGLAGSAAAIGVVSGAASINEKAPRVSPGPVTQFNPMMNPPAASPVVKTGPSGGPGAHGIPRKPIPAPLALSKPPQSDLQSATGDVPVTVAPVMPAAQPSPTLSAFSDGFVPATPVQGPVDSAALVAAGKPAPVYRVQMDYIPSQPDELEIRVGSLVRMLHEYDDGWALCIRMDRSHQGVCPRTCLSPRPVKPRPNPAPGSPANQQRRGPPPAKGPGPHNPQARPQSPANSQRYIPYPGSRPGTPQSQRPQTPKTPRQVPQITVTPTEPEFPEAQPEAQDKPASEAPPNPNAPVFHAM